MTIMNIDAGILDAFRKHIEKSADMYDQVQQDQSKVHGNIPAATPPPRPSPHVNVAGVTSGQPIPRVAATNTPSYGNAQPATTPGKPLDKSTSNNVG